MKLKSILFFLGITCATSLWAQQKPDTLIIDGVTIIRDYEEDTVPLPEKKGFFKQLNSTIRPKRLKTEWLNIDLGFSNYTDRTNYLGVAAQGYAPGSNEEWFDLKTFRSRNVNIWLVTQELNLLRHYLHLQYALGFEFNNYHYKQPIRYDEAPPAITNAPTVHFDNTPDRTYKKNKLAANYITAPLMLNLNLTPDRLYPFRWGAGISIGYLYASRNKTITSDEGKKKAKDDFDLRPWKLSYVTELSLGVVTFYASLASKTMYQRGLDLTPYNVGIRFRPVSIFSKIESP